MNETAMPPLLEMEIQPMRIEKVGGRVALKGDESRGIPGLV
jgi:hypothetical protein